MEHRDRTCLLQANEVHSGNRSKRMLDASAQTRENGDVLQVQMAGELHHGRTGKEKTACTSTLKVIAGRLIK